MLEDDWCQEWDHAGNGGSGGIILEWMNYYCEGTCSEVIRSLPPAPIQTGFSDMLWFFLHARTLSCKMYDCQTVVLSMPM